MKFGSVVGELALVAGGFAAVAAGQAVLFCAGEALFPRDREKEFIFVAPAESRAAVERADREERRVNALDSDNLMLAVECAVLRERLRLAVPDGVEAAGGADKIPATNLPEGK